jgi:predicted DNA-binding protein (UPF0251 family)
MFFDQQQLDFMPRPKNDRTVKEPPLFKDFKPTGIPARSLRQLILSLDEFEALRLADHLGFSQEEAAEEMCISRSTFSRLVEKSRQKVAEFLITGKRLTIDGGKVHFQLNILQCKDCGCMTRVRMDQKIEQCSHCGSKQLLSLAGGFGHGDCCRKNNH